MHTQISIALMFYSVLLEYISKGGHSPPIAAKLKSLHDPSFSFPATSLDDFVFRYFGSTKENQEKLRVIFCEAAFRDLISTMNNPDVARLFQKFQRISNTVSHLFILILTEEKDFPDFTGVFSNNRELYKQYLLGNKRKLTVHISNEQL